MPSFLFSVSQVTSSVESTFKADAAFIEIEKKLKKVLNHAFIFLQVWFQNIVFLTKIPTLLLLISFFVRFFERSLILVSLSTLKLAVYGKLHVSNKHPFFQFHVYLLFQDPYQTSYLFVFCSLFNSFSWCHIKNSWIKLRHLTMWCNCDASIISA